MKRIENLNFFLIITFTIFFSFTVQSCYDSNKERKEFLADSLLRDSIDRATDSIRATWTHEDSLEFYKADSIIKAKALQKYNKEHGIKQKPKDVEGDGKVYDGDYSYPKVRTVTINGKLYDIAIGQYEYDMLRRLPKPERKVESNNMRILYWDNNKVQVYEKGDEVYDVVTVE